MGKAHLKRCWRGLRQTASPLTLKFETFQNSPQTLAIRFAPDPAPRAGAYLLWPGYGLSAATNIHVQMQMGMGG